MSELRQRQPRVHNERHLDFIRSLPCVVSKNNIETQAAHIRFTDARIGKFNAGVGAKPDDRWTVPLSNDKHAEQHEIGDERRFWEQYNIDPIEIAQQLYAVSGDYEQGYEIVMNAGKSKLESIMAAG